MAKKTLGKLFGDAYLLQEAAKKLPRNRRFDIYEELNSIILQILRKHLNKVHVRFEARRPQDWYNHLAVIEVARDATDKLVLKIPVYELRALDEELSQKVRNKMEFTFAQRKVAEALAIGFGGNLWVATDGSSSSIRNVGADVTESRPYWGFVRRQIEKNGDVTLSVSDSDGGSPVVSIKVVNASATEQAYEMSDDIVVLACNREALFDHHVDALAGQVISLIRFTVEKYPESVQENEELSYQAWAKSQQLLAQLYAEALPDPLDENEWEELPETYWKYVYTDSGSFPVVIHKEEGNRVDSKKTAVHTVLLLRKMPEMRLADAVKSATNAHGYRPE